MKLIDKDAVVAEINRRIEEITLTISLGNKKIQKSGGNRRAELVRFLSFLDTLEVKEIGVDLGDPKGDKSAKYIIDTKTLEVKEMQEKTESIWHDANQQPTMYRKYLVRYSDGRVSGSWERHDNGFIPWKDVVKEHGFTHWCYVEDLIKLQVMTDKVQKIREEVEKLHGNPYYMMAIKDVLEILDMQEEPVSAKDKLRALSGGERDLGWLKDAKDVERYDGINDDLRSLVDKESVVLWKEINSGNRFSIVDSFNQFYGICMQVAESAVEWQNKREEPVSEELK